MAAPVITPIADQCNVNGDVVNLPIVATDADGDNLTCSAINLPTGLAVVPNAGTQVTVDMADFVLISSNATQLVWEQTLPGGEVFRVQQDNITATAGPTTLNNAGATPFPEFTHGTGSGSISTRYVEIQLSFFLDGVPYAYDGQFKYQVNDIDDPGTVEDITVISNSGTVTALGDNLTSTLEWPTLSGQTEVTFRWNSNSSGNNSKFGYDTGTFDMTPPGSGCSIQGTITAANGTDFATEVTVDDGTGNTPSESWTWVVNAPPTIDPVAGSPITIQNGDVYNLVLVVSDLNPSHNPTVSITNIPPGLSYDDGTRTLSGTATTGGTYNLVATATDGCGATGVENFTIIVNDPPTSTIADQANDVGDVVSVPSTIADPDSAPLTVVVTGLPPGLSYNSGTNVYEGTPTDAGTYPVIVDIDDGEGGVTQDNFNWVITLQNTAPTIPLVNRENLVGDSITIATGISDPDSDPFSCTITNLPPGITYDSVGNQYVGSPSTAGLFTVNIICDDSISPPSQESFTWLINTPPDLIIANQANQLGDTVSLTLNIDEPDGDDVTCVAANLPPGLVYDDATKTISGTTSTAGTFNVQISCTDEHGASDIESIVWTVNTPPVIPFTDQLDNLGDVVNKVIGETDAESNPTTCTVTGLPSGLSYNDTTGAVTGTPVSAGIFTVTIVCDDGQGGQTQEQILWEINAPPTATSPGNQSNIVGDAVSFTATFLDPDDTSTVDAVTGLPPGITFDSLSGLISGNPTTPGNYSVTMTTTDPHGLSDVENFDWLVISPPDVVAPATQTDPINSAVSLFVVATDFEGSVTYMANGLPPGLTINPVTGEISGSTVFPGCYDIEVTVTDTDGLTDSEIFTWCFTSPTAAPDIGPEPFIYCCTLTDDDGEIVVFLSGLGGEPSPIGGTYDNPDFSTWHAQSTYQCQDLTLVCTTKNLCNLHQSEITSTVLTAPGTNCQ